MVYGIQEEPTLLRTNSDQLLFEALRDWARDLERTENSVTITKDLMDAINNYGRDQYETGKEDGYERAEQDYLDGKW